MQRLGKVIILLSASAVIADVFCMISEPAEQNIVLFFDRTASEGASDNNSCQHKKSPMFIIGSAFNKADGIVAFWIKTANGIWIIFIKSVIAYNMVSVLTYFLKMV